MSTVEIQQNHMCIADLPTEKIRHLINGREGPEKRLLRKKILFYWEAVEYSGPGGY